MTRLMLSTAAATALLAGTAAAQDMQNMIDTSEVTVDGSTVTFPSVTAAEDGYVVLHEVQNGQPVVPGSIGHAPIAAGETMDVSVTSATGLAAGEDYVAMLHAETNDNGTYDFGEGSTDVDTPLMENDAPVLAQFTVDEDDMSQEEMESGEAEGDEMASDDMASEEVSGGMDDMMPRVVTRVMIEGDTVTIPSLVAEQDGYIVIHSMVDGGPVVPQSLGHAPVSAGMNESVEVTIEYPFAEGEDYMAMLHVESNDNGTYDFGEGNTDVDMPVTRDGEIVASVFDAM